MKVDLFSQRSLHLVLFHLLPFLCHDVAANTEIINFSSSRERSVDLPLDVVGNWSTLHPSDYERQWTLEPAALHTPLHQVCEPNDDTVASHPPFSCPHELWLLLDLDDEKWASYSTFTLRLSWPASITADFAITTYSPEDLLARFSERDLISSSPERERTRTHTSSSTPRTPTTRFRYARIRAVDTGVPTPGLGSHSPRRASPASHHPHPGMREEPASLVVQEGGGTVPFVVILEPSYLGVLPATLLPTVGFLIPILLAAALFVPWVTAYFEPFAQQAREDLKARMTRTSKER